MRPYYEDPCGIRIYHGDCRDVLASFPACFRVDAVITDPPFGIGFSEYESHQDKPEEYAALVVPAITAAESHVACGWVVVFQSAIRVAQWPVLWQRPFRIAAYPKTFTQILKNIGPIHSTDYALFWPVGEPRTPRGYGRDFCVSPTHIMKTREKGHPCGRPITQMLHAVDVFSLPGDTVLDLFMGAGTTLLAAKEMGRRAIGIEIEEKYCEIAAKRLAQGVLPLHGEVA